MFSKECLLISSDIEVIHMSIVLNRLSSYILVVQFLRVNLGIAPIHAQINRHTSSCYRAYIVHTTRLVYQIATIFFTLGTFGQL